MLKLRPGLGKIGTHIPAAEGMKIVKMSSIPLPLVTDATSTALFESTNLSAMLEKSELCLLWFPSGFSQLECVLCLFLEERI